MNDSASIPNKPLCIYHSNCADGFGAAWVVRRAFNGYVEFYRGVHQNRPPQIEPGRIVIFVDFSYKRDVMIELMKQRPEAILLLDHHKSAAEDLQVESPHFLDMSNWEGKLSWSRFLENIALDHVEGGPRIYTVFDMNRSGAGLAWDFFFPNERRPKLIDHIEDRDLWRFKHEGTREIQAALFSYSYDFETWDRLFRMPVDELRAEGTAIERKHHKDIAELIGVVTRKMRIAGYTVPIANLPYTLTSDAGHKLAEGYPFAGCYWDTPQGRVFSLRSRAGGADVARIAASYGGGGHEHASGFRVSFEKAREFEEI